MTGTKRILAVLGITLLSLQLSKGQAPSGDTVIQVTDSPVYYLTGDWAFANTFTGEGGAPLPVDFTIHLDHTAKGRIMGNESYVTLNVGGYSVAANYRVKGSVSGGGDKPTKLTLAVSLYGEDVLAGADTRFSIKLNYALIIDGANVGGTVRGNAKLGSLGSAKLRQANFTMVRPNNDLSNELPNFPSGDWKAGLSILPLKKLSGTGNFVVGPAVLPATLSGKYSEKKNTGSITLKGKDQAKGSTVKFYYTGSNPTDMKGVLLGQRVR